MKVKNMTLMLDFNNTNKIASERMEFIVSIDISWEFSMFAASHWFLSYTKKTEWKNKDRRKESSFQSASDSNVDENTNIIDHRRKKTRSKFLCLCIERDTIKHTQQFGTTKFLIKRSSRAYTWMHRHTRIAQHLDQHWTV